MGKEIKIQFVDFWAGFDEKCNYIYDLLSKRYNVTISDDPTYLFFSNFGWKHLNYNCIKIYFTGENVTPDFAIADYAISFDHLSFGDRYVRLPHYPTYPYYKSILEKKTIDRESLLNRKFCSFVYSNNKFADPKRNDFYKILSNYKRIDSGGKLFNNVGGRVADKLDFIKDYKFNIAFENSWYDGYTTEKMMDPMCVFSLPIYWGNPSVSKDFNPKSFVNASDFNSLQDLAKYIEYLDTNDDAYLEKLSEPWILEEQIVDWNSSVLDFLSYIIEQDPSVAVRVVKYGCTGVRLRELQRVAAISNSKVISKTMKYIGRLKKIVKK